MSHQRLDVSFDSGGTRCAAWLFLPDSADPAPVVVMGHGFSGVRDVRLPAYAERFAEHGLASFVFDYRHFGDSEGEPRQLLDWRKQLEDWRAALAHVRGMEEVDAGRVAVWGTSFGGGHAIVTAAGDDGVVAAVAQVPFVDGAASLRAGIQLRFAARVLAAGLRDLAQSALGMAPHYVPAVSPPEEFGCLNRADSYSGFMALIPPDSTWSNRVAARVLLTIGSYRPIAHAPKLECPLLVVAARHDSLIPIGDVERLAAQARSAHLVILDVGHFDVYTGEIFDEVATLEARFLAEHLRSAPT